jgi:hypothetical protein
VCRGRVDALGLLVRLIRVQHPEARIVFRIDQAPRGRRAEPGRPLFAYVPRHEATMLVFLGDLVFDPPFRLQGADQIVRFLPAVLLEQHDIPMRELLLGVD